MASIKTININYMNNTQLTVKDYFSKDSNKAKFEELLGTKSTGFIASALQVVGGNASLMKSDPKSVFNAVAMAAVLDLPINSNLGFAHVVPYNESFQDSNGQWQKRSVAQFQLGYKGFIQLALRSKEYETIGASEIYEGQLVSFNPLEGSVFDFSKPSKGNIIGYAAHFKLKDGFKKTLYMAIDEVIEHGKKYSKTFDNAKSVWKTNQNGMALKTVLKLLISKYGPMSLELQTAVISDQAIVENFESNEFKYPDSKQGNEAPESVSKMNQETEDAEIIDDDDEVI
jgi:recombination protein RecT